MKPKKLKRSWKMWALIFPCGAITRVSASKLEARGPWSINYIKATGMELKKVTVTED